MGRGRQKAKQTKVARALKYHSASIDVTALERELSSGGEDRYDGTYRDGVDDADDGDDDPYSAYGSEDDDEASDYASQSRGR